MHIVETSTFALAGVTLLRRCAFGIAAILCVAGSVYACDKGQIQVGGSQHPFCEPASVVEDYDRLAAKRSMMPRAEFRQSKEMLSTKELNHLREFLEDVFPSTGLTRDEAIMALWWVKIECLLGRDDTPWAYSSCIDGDGKTTYDFDYDCPSRKSGKWQVGYGIQVTEALGRLKKAFDKTHPRVAPVIVGDAVLQEAKSKLRFPASLTASNWSILTSPKGSPIEGRSNYYWASVLMRDPKISAILVSEEVRSDPSCYAEKHPKWCDGYYARREQHSLALLTLLDAWNEIAPRRRNALFHVAPSTWHPLAPAPTGQGTH